MMALNLHNVHIKGSYMLPERAIITFRHPLHNGLQTVGHPQALYHLFIELMDRYLIPSDVFYRLFADWGAIDLMIKLAKREVSKVIDKASGEAFTALNEKQEQLKFHINLQIFWQQGIMDANEKEAARIYRQLLKEVAA